MSDQNSKRRVRIPMDPWERISRWLDMSGGPESCWEWQGHRSQGNYGLTYLTMASGKNRTTLAHRAVYQLLTGTDLVTSQFLLHSCDNPPCCNPRHLRIGDQLQNMADRIRRGAGYLRGLDNWRAVRHLTDEDVAEIRATYKWHTQGHGAPALGARFGVGRRVIEDIVNRQGRWVGSE